MVMDNSKKKAFMAYKNSAHENVRKIKEGTSTRTYKLNRYLNIVRLMNEVFANSSTRRGVRSNGPGILYRGLGTIPNSIKNKGHLNNRSFSSWSSKRNVAATFKNNNGLMLRLNTSTLKNIPVVSYKNNVNKSNVEFEYILPPMKFKVTSLNKNYVNVVPAN